MYNLFTKEFIQSINDTYIPKTGLKDSNGKDFVEGQYIGTINTNDKTIDYTTLVGDVYKNVEPYFSSYQNMYNNLSSIYGHKITNLIVNKTAMPISPEEILAVAQIIDKAREINSHG